jgi:hypothetical protein
MEKRKRFFSSGGPGGEIWPSRAQGRARARAGASAPAQSRPTARNGAGARETTPLPRAHASRRAGGGDGASGEPADRGENPVAGGSTAIRRWRPGSWASGRRPSTRRGWRA